MPTETFFNLPDDKRERFVEAAVDEFSSRPYDQASISRIVKHLGIAKGSVYQYFGSKLDLFTWLIGEAGSRRVAMAVTGDDPLDAMAKSWRVGLAHWRQAPRWNRLLLRLMEPTTEPRLQAVARDAQQKSHAYLAQLLRDAGDEGLLRPGLDVDTAAWLALGVMQHGLMQAFLARIGMDIDTFVLQAGDLDDAVFEAALDVADESILFLRRAVFVDSA